MHAHGGRRDKWADMQVSGWASKRAAEVSRQISEGNRGDDVQSLNESLLGTQ